VRGVPHRWGGAPGRCGRATAPRRAPLHAWGWPGLGLGLLCGPGHAPRAWGSPLVRGRADVTSVACPTRVGVARRARR